MESGSKPGYLVPKGIWLKRTVTLFSFIILDYLVTLILCKQPNAEGNFYVRNFMQDFGVPIGLTIFDLLMAAPIYLILCIDSHLVKLSGEFSTVLELSTDLGLGWLVAGLHFDGAMSWLVGIPGILCQITGLIVYELIMVYPLIRTKSDFTRYLAHLFRTSPYPRP